MTSHGSFCIEVVLVGDPGRKYNLQDAKAESSSWPHINVRKKLFKQTDLPALAIKYITAQQVIMGIYCDNVEEVGVHVMDGRDTPSADRRQDLPIVLVPGFLGPGWDPENCDPDSLWYSYWGEAAKLDTTESPVLCAWPSGLASMHDRACELFAQIKGGVVDFGEEHSKEFGHSRYGREYEGLYPEWSASKPIHVVGHSLGGNTLRVLQHLLSQKAFPLHDTSENWIVSITALNSPLNGSLTAYALGEKEADAPNVVGFSPGHVLGSIVHVFSFLNIRPLGFDVSLDQWNLSYKAASWLDGLKKTLLSISVHSALVESEDNAAFDASVHAMAKWNRRIGACHPHTYYISLVGTGQDANTVPTLPEGFAAAQWANWLGRMAQFGLRRSILSAFLLLTNRRSYADLKAALQDMHWESWGGDSDGLCCTFAQSFPQIGLDSATPNCRLPSLSAEMRPGVWYMAEHGQDHMGIVPFPVSEAAQCAFFWSLFERLRALPTPATEERVGLDVSKGEWRAEGLSALVREVGSDQEASDADTELPGSPCPLLVCVAAQ